MKRISVPLPTGIALLTATACVSSTNGQAEAPVSGSEHPTSGAVSTEKSEPQSASRSLKPCDLFAPTISHLTEASTRAILTRAPARVLADGNGRSDKAPKDWLWLLTYGIIK